jgi:hypothetical protein
MKLLQKYERKKIGKQRNQKKNWKLRKELSNFCMNKNNKLVAIETNFY